MQACQAHYLPLSITGIVKPFCDEALDITPATSCGLRHSPCPTCNAFLVNDCTAALVQKLYVEGGVARFYKGFTPCLLRAFPANGIMLLTVDSVNNMLDK